MRGKFNAAKCGRCKPKFVDQDFNLPRNRPNSLTETKRANASSELVYQDSV